MPTWTWNSRTKKTNGLFELLRKASYGTVVCMWRKSFQEASKQRSTWLRKGFLKKQKTPRGLRWNKPFHLRVELAQQTATSKSLFGFTGQLDQAKIHVRKPNGLLERWLQVSTVVFWWCWSQNSSPSQLFVWMWTASCLKHTWKEENNRHFPDIRRFADVFLSLISSLPLKEYSGVQTTPGLLLDGN